MTRDGDVIQLDGFELEVSGDCPGIKELLTNAGL